MRAAAREGSNQTLVEAVCQSAHSTANNLCSLMHKEQDAATRGECRTSRRDAPPAHPTARPLLPLRTAGWARCRLGTTPAVWARCRASTTRPHWTAKRTRPFGACHHQEVESFALEPYRVESVSSTGWLQASRVIPCPQTAAILLPHSNLSPHLFPSLPGWHA